MAAGGIYDQVGGGFHRYSTDAYWLVPHFEKMLYDQALLVARVPARLAGDRRARATAASSRRRSTYVLRDLRHADGGFFSAEDADSEGIEGKFYLWSLEEIEALCGDDAAEVVRYFGVTARRELRRPAHRLPGQHPARRSTRTEDRPDVGRRACCPALFAAREQRVRPGLDDKVLLGWNALFLRSLVEAAPRSSATTGWTRRATNAAFLLARAAPRRRPAPAVVAGRPRPTCSPYAEDYAALLEALLTLAELDDVAWLAEARAVADDLVAPVRRRRARRLLHHRRRRRSAHRAAQGLPGQRDAVGELARRRRPAPAGGAHRRRRRRPARASGGSRTLAPVLGEHPTAFAFLLEALERVVQPPVEVAIVGDAGRRPRRARSTCCAPGVLPASVRVTAAPGVGADLTPLLADRALVDGKPAAYVCERFACRLPVTDADGPARRARRPPLIPTLVPTRPAEHRQHPADEQEHGDRAQRDRAVVETTRIGRIRDTGRSRRVRAAQVRPMSRARCSVLPSWWASTTRRNGRSGRGRRQPSPVDRWP